LLALKELFHHLTEDWVPLYPFVPSPSGLPPCICTSVQL
jgi:hypothetical protein